MCVYVCVCVCVFNKHMFPPNLVSRCESVLHPPEQHQGENGNLLPLEDQLGAEGVTTSPRTRPGRHRLEEDFEEDTLEDEEEEDEDEEEEDEDEDLAAEQVRFSCIVVQH